MRSLIARSASPLGGDSKAAAAAVLDRLVLDIDVEPQVQKRWCWAAIGAALLLLHHGLRWSQAEVASAVLGLDCKANPANCNMDMSMASVLRGIQCRGAPAVHIVELEAFLSEISSGRPAVLRVERSVPAVAGPPFAHFVLVKGYARAERLLEIDDPDGGETKSVSFDALRNGQVPHLGRWTDTIWTGTGA